MANAFAPERKPTPLSTSKVQSQAPGICLQSEQAHPSLLARTRLLLALARLCPSVLLDSETHTELCATAARLLLRHRSQQAQACLCYAAVMVRQLICRNLHTYPPDNPTGKMTRTEKETCREA